MKNTLFISPQAIKRLKSLSVLILTTLLLTACGGGGSSGGGGGGGTSDPDGVITDPVGTIRGIFPDDGAVSWTLNITKQNLASPTVSLNVTTTITGTCSISPAVATGLIYGPNNQTTTSFDVTFIGTATRGGSCVVNFAVNEAVNELTNLGVQTRNLRRIVTFNAELAPNIVATLLGNATGDSTNVPANQAVRVNVTATKQDEGKNLSVIFPATIISSSSPSCIATLAGSPPRQYVISGTSVSVIYNVGPPLVGAVSNCGTFTFTTTEGSAIGTAEFFDPISFTFVDGDADNIDDNIDNCPMIANPGQSDINSDGEGDVCDTDSDSDGDTVMDAADVDADGDGLIEISTAAELNMMRYNLNGTGLDDGASDNDNTTGGNSIGCGGGSYVNGTAITACNGYEQMADIDLNDLPDNAIPGNNWEPVGSCTSMPDEFNRIVIECATNAFSGVFSGNNFTISNLLIHITTTSYGVGFFGVISPNTEVHNVHIRGGNINVTETRSEYAGGLVGFGNGATISNSSVTLDALSGGDSVGGLLGYGIGATISSSAVTVGSISGAGNVGGLVGFGYIPIISSSVAIVGSIIGTRNVALDFGDARAGGLVGNGDLATISSSVAIVGSISAGQGEGAGGLAGNGNDATISSSVATVGSIVSSGIRGAAGLVSFGEDATISSSLAVTNRINSTSHLGGLAGFSGELGGSNRDPSNVTASYWDATTLTPPDTRMLNVSKFGSGQTTAVLTNQISFTGTGNIYATWGDAYCNPNTGEYSATAPSPLGDYIRVWDLGTSSQYPAITCVQRLLPLDIQREAARRALAGELPLVD